MPTTTREIAKNFQRQQGIHSFPSFFQHCWIYDHVTNKNQSEVLLSPKTAMVSWMCCCTFQLQHTGKLKEELTPSLPQDPLKI